MFEEPVEYDPNTHGVLPALSPGVFPLISGDAIHIRIRKQLALAIETKRLASEYLFNSFSIEQTWLPRENYHDLISDHPQGKVILACKAITEGNNRVRDASNPVAMREAEIFVAYQRAGVDSQDTSSVDQYVSFLDQLYETARLIDKTSTGENYQWSRNEALVDENGMPYDYAELHGNNLFLAVFSAVYLTVINP